MLTLIILVVVIGFGAIAWATSANANAALAKARAAALAEAAEEARQIAEDARRLKAEAQEAVSEFKAAFEAIRAAEPTNIPDTKPRDARRQKRNSELEAVLMRRAAKPTPASRPLYWLEPPIEIAPDHVVKAHIDAVHRLNARIEICFTGWTDEEKEELHERAVRSACVVRAAVSHHLTFLCVGATPGPTKLDHAAGQRVPLISADQFERLIAPEMPF
jgi:NAD-dependent DNA ligase